MSRNRTACNRSAKKSCPLKKAERRREDRERIERATKELLSSDGWRRWVEIRSRNGLARYSFGNQLLIAMQCPEATFVAGFRAFLGLNRCVRKGEKGIRIFAPMPIREKTESVAASDLGEQGRRIAFRTVSVFDVSQTEPLPGTEPVPLEAPAEKIEGDSHIWALPRLGELAEQLGFTVEYRHVPGFANGWCESKTKMIVVNTGLSINGRVRVLVHELAHARGIGYADYGRATAEVIVDTVTYIVCASIGLDVSGSSIPYVAGWGEDGELRAIAEYAEVIDRTAREIEEAVG